MFRVIGYLSVPVAFFASDYTAQLLEHHKLRDFYFTQVKPDSSYKPLGRDQFPGIFEKGLCGFDLNMRRSTAFAVYGGTLFTFLWANYFKAINSFGSNTVPIRFVKTGISTLVAGPAFMFTSLIINKAFREWIKADMNWSVESQVNLLEWYRKESWGERLYEDRFAQMFLHLTNFMLFPINYNFMGYTILSCLYNPIASRIRFDPGLALVRQPELVAKIEATRKFD